LPAPKSRCASMRFARSGASGEGGADQLIARL
jgi:hypothetical protein